MFGKILITFIVSILIKDVVNFEIKIDQDNRNSNITRGLKILPIEKASEVSTYTFRKNEKTPEGNKRLGCFKSEGKEDCCYFLPDSLKCTRYVFLFQCDDSKLKFYIDIDEYKIYCPLNIEAENCYLNISLRKNIWYTVGKYSLIVLGVIVGLITIGCTVLFIMARQQIKKEKRQNLNNIY